VGFNGSNYIRIQTADENSYNYSLQYKLKPGKVIQTTEINTFYSNEGRIFVKNYYTAAGYMLSYVETTKFSNYYYGAQVHNKIKISNNYLINAGGEFYGFHISTPTDAVDYIQGLSFQNRVSSNARSYLTGVYVENVFIPKEGFKIVAGLRYDHALVYEGDVYSNLQDKENQEDKNAISGNIAASWRLKSSKIKLNAARSFRMPETTELYADSYTSNGILYANPELEPEYCHSFDISYNYENKCFDVELSPFIWFVDNMIFREEIKGMPGTNYQFINLERSRIYGGEVSTNLWLRNIVSEKDKLTASWGVAYLNATNIETQKSLWSDGTPMDYVPPFNLKGNMGYNSPNNKIFEYHIAFRLTYYYEQTRLGKSKYATPAYTVLGCSAGFSLNKYKTKPSLNIAVNNLLNNEYYSYLSYLPSEGRDIRVFLTINFN
jgi:outer membrane receptor protein involved in Fe transport